MSNTIDFDKYSGKWYNLIYPAGFKWQKNCPFAEAIYDYDKVNHLMMIENICLNNDMKVTFSRKGVGYVPDSNKPNELIVQFNDGLPADPVSDIPNYHIHWTDYENYAFVGNPEKGQLWFLSRTPTVSKDKFPWIYKNIKEFGYDPNNLLSNLRLFK